MRASERKEPSAPWGFDKQHFCGEVCELSSVVGEGIFFLLRRHERRISDCEIKIAKRNAVRGSASGGGAGPSTREENVGRRVNKIFSFFYLHAGMWVVLCEL